MPVFRRSIQIPASADTAYAWHAHPGAFERLSPPWKRIDVLDRNGTIETDGGRVTVSIATGPIRTKWVAEHYGAVPGREFHDVQIRGPFASWEHHHRFVPNGESSSHLEDEVHYALPFRGLLGSGYIRRELDRLFTFRQERTRQDLRAHVKYSERKRLRVLVTGSSGLVGRELVPFLTTGGHDVKRLPRGEHWDPERGILDVAALAGIDAVVHLAGENIAAGRWTGRQKERIRSSRVDGTRLLSEALAQVNENESNRDRPPVLVSASAIGYYGDRGDEVLTEDSVPGEGFLANVCQEWENATRAASDAGVRVVNPRIGIVLSPKDGALAKMLTPFRMGVGGVIGDGEQYMSWISIDDLVGLIHAALMEPDMAGPVNAVAPSPVTNREFTKTLGRVLNRPTVLPLPAAAARIALGEMAEELLLSSAQVSTTSSYEYRHPTLETALRHLLGR